jgi:membrane protein implicated in regulation of membrane protease activity
MKNLGWHLFWSLLLADVVAIAMLKLGVTMKVTMIVSALVFVILAVVMFIANNAHQRTKKREEEANAKIVELQDQVAEKYSKERVDGATV